MVSADPFDQINYPRIRLRKREAIQRDLDKLLSEIRARSHVGLHLGAGSTKLPGMINCDQFDPEADKKVDAVQLDSFLNDTVDLIETHHMIEHLSFSEAAKALREWYRVLRPGGIVVLTCPDFTRVCIRWLKYTFLYPVRPRPKKLEYILKMALGSQEHEGMFHKSAYDARHLRYVFSEVGFNTKLTYSPYPLKRRTPSLLAIARKP